MSWLRELGEDLLLAQMVRYRQMKATFGATTGKDFAAVGGRHASAETVLVDSLAVGGLECSFHCLCMSRLIIVEIFRGANLQQKIRRRKKIGKNQF